MTNDHNTERLLIQCFSAVFPSLSSQEIVQAEQHLMPAWDSIAFVTLISIIEEEFRIEVSPEEVENLVSFDTFLNYLASAPNPSEL